MPLSAWVLEPRFADKPAGFVMDQKTEDEKIAARKERKKASAAAYRARKRQDPQWVEKTKAYQADRYARLRQDPKWVAEQDAKREEKRQDPVWVEEKRAREAARYQEKRANGETYYDTTIKPDPEKVAKKKAWEIEWKKNNPERWKEIQKNSDERKRHEDLLKFLLKHVRAIAKRKGIEFDIEPADFAMPEFCPVLGIPITPWARDRSAGVPSFDRIDPRKGYVKGDVKIISNRANRLKCDCINPEELRAVANYIEQNLGSAPTEKPNAQPSGSERAPLRPGKKTHKRNGASTSQSAR